MQFDFATTPHLIVRPGVMSRPQEWLPAGATRIFLITDPGLLQAGIVTPVAQALRQYGCTVTVYHEVEADPPEARVQATVSAARAAHAELIIGLGGGSSLDTAKLVALLAATPQSLDAIYGIGLACGPRLPLVR